MFKFNANSNSPMFKILARAEEKLAAAATATGATLITLAQAAIRIGTIVVTAGPDKNTFTGGTCLPNGDSDNVNGWSLIVNSSNSNGVNYSLYGPNYGPNGNFVQTFTEVPGQSLTFNQGSNHITITTQSIGTCSYYGQGAQLEYSGGTSTLGPSHFQPLYPFLADHALVLTIGGLVLLAVGASFLIDYSQNGVARRVVYRLDAGMPLDKSMGSTSEKRLRMLNRRPPAQQDAIFSALARTHAPDAASELKRIARTNQGLSKKAVDALSESGTRSALGALKDLVLNSNPQTRVLAFEALTKWAMSDNTFAPRAREIISEFTCNQDRKIRGLTYEAMKGMCNASPNDAAKVIAPITELVPLGAIRIEDSISEANKVLLDLLGSEHPEVVRAAATTLKTVLDKLGTKECRTEELSIIIKALPAGALSVLREVAPEHFGSD